MRPEVERVSTRALFSMNTVRLLPENLTTSCGKTGPWSGDEYARVVAPC